MDLTKRIFALEIARATEEGHLETLRECLGPILATNAKIVASTRKAEVALAVGVTLTEVRRFIELEALEALAAGEPDNGALVTAARTLVAQITRKFETFEVPANLIDRAKEL